MTNFMNGDSKKPTTHQPLLTMSTESALRIWNSLGKMPESIKLQNLSVYQGLEPSLTLVAVMVDFLVSYNPLELSVGDMTFVQRMLLDGLNEAYGVSFETFLMIGQTTLDGVTWPLRLRYSNIFQTPTEPSSGSLNILQ